MPDENPLFKMDDDALIKYLCDKAEIHARNILIARGEMDLATFWHLVTPNQNFLVATPWRDDAEKDAAVDFIRATLKSDKAKAYCFTSEAWLARYEKGEIDQDSEQWPSVRPSNRPDRMEVVAIFASTRSKQFMRTLEMIRDPGGKVIDLKALERPYLEDAEEGAEIGGTMPSLFDDA